MQHSFDDHLRRQSKLALASRCVRFVVVVALVVALVLAAGGWLDRWLVLGRNLRWLVLVSLLGGLVAVTTLWLLSFRRTGGRLLLAELDRAAALDAGYVISTAAEFAGVRGSDAVEQAMLAHLRHKAEELIATSTPRHPWPSAFIIVATSAGIAALVALVVGHGDQPLLRIFKPWVHQPYTQLTVIPMADPLPVKGEPFVIHGQATGRIPERGVLRMASGAERAFQIAADGTFEIAFPQGLTVGETAVARAGKDGVSKPLDLAFRIPPKVVNYAHEVVPPSYTGLAPTHETLPSFTLVRGSELRFEVTFDEKPSAARMVFENDRAALDLQVDPADPRKWSADLGPVPRGFGYRLDVADHYGTFSLADEPQQVVATPDRPPTIQLVKNNSTEIKSRSETLKFEVDAKDDFGLYQIRVHAYRVGGNEGAPKELARFDPTKTESRDSRMTWELDLRKMDANPMDMVVVVFEAVDGNTFDGPGRAFTDPFLFEVPEDADEGTGSPPAGGQPGGQPETVNPLAMQRQLYRETLQLTLGRGKLSMADAARRQQEVFEAIGKMREEPESPSPEFTELLKKAWSMARRASFGLKGKTLFAGDRSPNSPLRLQEETIQLLVQAAQIQREMQKAQPPPPEGGQPPPPAPPSAKPSTKYTLIAPPSAPAENEKEKQGQEKIDQALADIEKARSEQEKINKELEDQAKKDPKESKESKEAKESKEGKEANEGNEGESPGKKGESKSPSNQPGHTPGGSEKPGDPTSQESDPANPDGNPPTQEGDPKQPGDKPNLTKSQLELSELSKLTAEQIEKLTAADNRANPKQAAEQMRRAAELQREAAQALLRNAPGQARERGEDAQEALRRAAILTEALLDRAVAPGIDAGTRAPGYDDLIQGYSRRLSYDE